INARNERIITTLPKAKELRPFVERAISLSRRAQNLTGDDNGAQVVHLRRQAAAFFHAGNQGQARAAGGRRGQERPVRTAGAAGAKLSGRARRKRRPRRRAVVGARRKPKLRPPSKSQSSCFRFEPARTKSCINASALARHA